LVALRSVWGRKYNCIAFVQKLKECAIAQLLTSATLTQNHG